MVVTALCVSILVWLFFAPVRIGIKLRPGQEPGLEAGFAVWCFRRRFVLNGLELQGVAAKWDLDRLSKLKKAFRWLIRRVKIERIAVKYQGGQDAAASALLCGAMWAVADMLRELAPRWPVSLSTDFRSPDGRTHFEGIGIANLSMGHIMLATLAGVYHIVAGRIHKWRTTIQSRAL